MQRQSDFRIAIEPVVGDPPTERQSLKIDRALLSKAIRFRDIDMASKRLIDDYPDLAGWFCMSVKDRSEFAVENALKDAHVEACVPIFKGAKLQRRHGGMREALLPVIPGYIMVKCVPSIPAFRGLSQIKKVIGMIGNGGIPYRVPARYMEHFIQLARDGGYDYKPEPHGYSVGMMVRVTDGPFASFPAFVTSIAKAETEGRINVEVHIFGRATPVELDLRQIEPYCEPSKSMRVIRSRKIR